MCLAKLAQQTYPTVRSGTYEHQGNDCGFIGHFRGQFNFILMGHFNFFWSLQTKAYFFNRLT